MSKLTTQDGRTDGAIVVVPAAESKPMFVHARDLLASLPPEPRGVWGKYLVPGSITVLGKAPKMGGSTLSLAVAEATGSRAESFLGQEVNGGPVLYVSEEAGVTLGHKLPGGDVYLVTRDMLWPPPSWEKLLDLTAREARRVRAVAVVIDTFPHWAGLAPEKEKDAGAVQATMRPLQALAQDGLAVLLDAHVRKGGGEDGEGLRGSSALAGAVDTIIELGRVQNAPRQRTLLTVSRFPSTPGTLTIDYRVATGSWAVVGEGAERGDPRTIADRQALLSALQDGPLTRAELEDATGTLQRQWAGTLKVLEEEGLVERSGVGKRGKPHVYTLLRTVSAQAPAQHCAETASDDASPIPAPFPFRERQEGKAEVAAFLAGPGCAESEPATRSILSDAVPSTEAHAAAWAWLESVDTQTDTYPSEPPPSEAPMIDDAALDIEFKSAMYAAAEADEEPALSELLDDRAGVRNPQG